MIVNGSAGYGQFLILDPGEQFAGHGPTAFTRSGSGCSRAGCAGRCLWRREKDLVFASAEAAVA